METKKILLVDDDMMALDLMDILLERAGFDAVRHTDARWVIENYSSIMPDIILIDIMMPKLSGDECIAELRKLGYTVPIVAFTSLSDTEAHNSIIAKGASLVLTKPCKPDILIGHLRRLLSI